jgi:hypothetical protein
VQGIDGGVKVSELSGAAKGVATVTAPGVLHVHVPGVPPSPTGPPPSGTEPELDAVPELELEAEPPPELDPAPELEPVLAPELDVVPVPELEPEVVPRPELAGVPELEVDPAAFDPDPELEELPPKSGPGLEPEPHAAIAAASNAAIGNTYF